jgi:hypothetical protein
MVSTAMSQYEYLPGIEWPEPPVITPGDASTAPSDATVLFDGSDLSDWENGENWKVENGVAIVGRGDITTKQAFSDCQLHIEWSAPTEIQGDGQGRGNSGIFLMDRYEVQVLDSYDNKTYFDGQAGAIYKQTPPLVNAMRPPGEWNVYDIIWTAPRFKTNGEVAWPAYITLLHNGVLLLNHFELLGETPFTSVSSYHAHAERLPIRLQDHGNPVQYRNMWVREITPIVGKRVKPPMMRRQRDGEEFTIEEWQQRQTRRRGGDGGED